MAERRVLSSFDMLPEECQDDVVWALARLNERSRTQADILFELNDRLAVKGHGPVSKSAFSRRSVRLKRRRDQLTERDYLYAGIAETITPEKMNDADRVLGELIKASIDEFLDDATSAQELRDLSSAYRQTVSAQKLSIDLMTKAELEADRKMEKAVRAAEKAVGETGRSLDAEAVLAMIRKAYREGS